MRIKSAINKASKGGKTKNISPNIILPIIAPIPNANTSFILGVSLNEKPRLFNERENNKVNKSEEKRKNKRERVPREMNISLLYLESYPFSVRYPMKAEMPQPRIGGGGITTNDFLSKVTTFELLPFYQMGMFCQAPKVCHNNLYE